MRELVGITYFAICAAIAVWAARRTKTADDFFVAGRGVGLIPFAIAAMASTLSGFAFIGGPGLVYGIGMTAVFIILPAGVTNTLGAWVLGTRMHRLGRARGLLTVPDALAARYRSPAAQGLSAVAILAGVIGYVATNALALGVVIDALFATGLGPGIWIGTAVTLAYSVSGGILAGIYTDVFQGVVMAVASAAVFLFALDAGGGLPAITRTIEAADPALLGPWGTRGAMTALSFFFVFAVGSLGQPQIAHKYYMLRDIARLKWYPVLMTIAMLLAQLLFVGVGVAVKALVVRGAMAPLASPDDATPQFLLRFVPVVLSALVFAGVAAAIMSTVNSFLSIGAAALTHDLPRALGREPIRQLTIGRLWTVVIAVLAALLAQQAGLLVAFLGILGYGLFASTLVPALAIGLNWTGATREGALASIATGLTLTVVLEWFVWTERLTVPQGITVTGVTLVTSLVVFLGVSWLTRDRATGQLDPDVRTIMQDS
ncbi:MAG: sodium:solute symporter family transporter [Gemmatimonadaceae bacterium]